MSITHLAVLAIPAMGQTHAQVRGISKKRGVNQIDQLLSNGNLVLNTVLEAWVASW